MIHAKKSKKHCQPIWCWWLNFFMHYLLLLLTIICIVHMADSSECLLCDCSPHIHLNASFFVYFLCAFFRFPSKFLFGMTINNNKTCVYIMFVSSPLLPPLFLIRFNLFSSSIEMNATNFNIVFRFEPKNNSNMFEHISNVNKSELTATIIDRCYYLTLG